MKFVIVHLDKELYDWSYLEYKHISKIVGKKNLIFTNVKKGYNKLKKLGKVYKENISFKNACILDANAEKTLTKNDKFEYYIFGGILGDHPPKKRTKDLIKHIKGIKRNLGKEQMSTDTAVYVANAILNGKSLKDFKFQDGIELKLNEVETVEFPFRYILKNNKPLITPGLIKFLRERKEF